MTKQKKEFEMIGRPLLDPSHVMGLGTVVIDKSYSISWFDIDYLKKAIQIIETINPNATAICFAVSKDMPIIIGEKKEDKVSGVIIAPRLEEDQDH